MDTNNTAETKTETPAVSDDYSSYLQLANNHIKAEEYDEAYRCLSELAEKVPKSADVLTTTGALAVKLEKFDEALDYLKRAAELTSDKRDIYNNIGMLHVAREELTEAAAAFRKVIELAPEDAQGYNDLAVVLAHSRKSDEARQAFETAIEKKPDFLKAHDNFAEFCLDAKLFDVGLAAITKFLERNQSSPSLVKWKRIFEDILNSADREQISVTPPESTPRGLKIAFLSTQDSFADGILRHLSAHNEIRKFEGDSVEQIGELMEWADIAWFEWCDQLLIHATKMPKMCKIICRLHSYEAFTNMPDSVDWGKVDRLILVNHNVAEILNQAHNVPVKQEIIYNGVDLVKFTMPKNKTYGKKICSLGYINYKKNPGLLLYCFKAIHDWDPEFEFHIAGQHQDLRIKVYMDHLLKRLNIPVTLDNWVEDVPGYLADKDFVISTSYFESFHYSIAEGMASGVLPLVHAWPGSENVYPGDFMFDTPDDCVSLVRKLMSVDRKQLGMKNREYIARNFSLEKTIQGFNRVIRAVRST